MSEKVAEGRPRKKSLRCVCPAGFVWAVVALSSVGGPHYQRSRPAPVRPAVNVCEARWRATLRDLKSDQALLGPRHGERTGRVRSFFRSFWKQPARSARPRKADGRPLANGAAGRTGLDILDVGATV
jgi:hypothetical protein